MSSTQTLHKQQFSAQTLDEEKPFVDQLDQDGFWYDENGYQYDKNGLIRYQTGHGILIAGHVVNGFVVPLFNPDNTVTVVGFNPDGSWYIIDDRWIYPYANDPLIDPRMSPVSIFPDIDSEVGSAATASQQDIMELREGIKLLTAQVADMKTTESTRPAIAMRPSKKVIGGRKVPKTDTQSLSLDNILTDQVFIVCALLQTVFQSNPKGGKVPPSFLKMGETLDITFDIALNLRALFEKVMRKTFQESPNSVNRVLYDEIIASPKKIIADAQGRTEKTTVKKFWRNGDSGAKQQENAVKSLIPGISADNLTDYPALLFAFATFRPFMQKVNDFSVSEQGTDLNNLNRFIQNLFDETA